MTRYDPRPAALRLLETGEFSIEDLWLQYISRGGSADVLELDAFVHDIPLLHGLEVEILRVTLEEMAKRHRGRGH
jgi:hypothetical protein